MTTIYRNSPNLSSTQVALNSTLEEFGFISGCLCLSLCDTASGISGVSAVNPHFYHSVRNIGQQCCANVTQQQQTTRSHVGCHRQSLGAVSNLDLEVVI